MKAKIQTSFPTTLETWAVLFVTFAITIVGNGGAILNRLGLTTSSQLVKSEIGNSVNSGLGKLDSFSVTKNLVTFVAWSIVGLLTYSVVQSLLHAQSQLNYKKTVSSNAYIHGAGFNKTLFWHGVIRNIIITFGLIACLFILGVLYVIYIVPLGVHYTRPIIFTLTAINARNFLGGLCILFAATYLMYFVLKLNIKHHQRQVV